MKTLRGTRSRRRSVGAWLAAGVAALLSPCAAEGTIVRFDTTLGAIDVRLYDTATPQSVANFLNYVVDDDYDGSFFHRAPLTFRVDDQGNQVLDDNNQPIVDTFVVQGGGFTYTDADGLGDVPTDPPVQNEPGISNRFGTLAYAKLGGDPNSATSGFFFNTSNNVNNLDNQNGGFTVFGRVVQGIGNLEAITALQIFDLDGPGQTFDTVPLLNVPGTLEQNLIYVNDVVELDLPAGDFNFDGVVDAADYTVWRDTMGSSVDAQADGDGDGDVDLDDYQIWADSLTGSLSASVPEPSAAVLLLLGALGAPRSARNRWRRSRLAA